MGIPSIFIVGGPRCGTSALWTYLSAHPRVFGGKSKEPYHFLSDVPMNVRPFASRETYLKLFEAAGNRHAVDGSVLYLYSQAAPRAIQEFNPSAKIIIMLRDPVEMVVSVHARNVMQLSEDLPDLDEALAAEADRREGRRIPLACMIPLTLQYTFLARRAAHVQRYLDVFGESRVKCILFEDFRNDTERVYRETLAFLEIEPERLPDFKAINASATHWRSHRAARLIGGPLGLSFRLAFQLPPGLVRKSVLTALACFFYVPVRANRARGALPRPPRRVTDALRHQFKDDVQRLAAILGRDLSSWMRGPSEA